MSKQLEDVVDQIHRDGETTLAFLAVIADKLGAIDMSEEEISGAKYLVDDFLDFLGGVEQLDRQIAQAERLPDPPRNPNLIQRG